MRREGSRRLALALSCVVLLLWASGASADAPKNVILFIGDGMGFEQVKAARTYANGDSAPLSFETLPYQGQIMTYSADSSVTDSAAAATAIATGYKVNNGVISMAYPANGEYASGAEMRTLLEYFQPLARSTGLVTTTYMTHATPAAFGAHEPTRNNYGNIALDYFTQTTPDVLLGGGANGLETSAAQSAAAAAGYTIVTNRASMQALDVDTVGPVSGQFGTTYMPYEYDGSYATLPHLSEMTSTALDILDRDGDGFFLMVEGGRIDQACHDNNLRRAVHEVLQFAASVQLALDWAAGRTDTLILVTADHETGGLTVTDNYGAGVYPGVSWSTGSHTGVNVPVYAWGANAEMVCGTMNNTDLFAVATVPEPATMALLAAGAAALLRRRKR